MPDHTDDTDSDGEQHDFRRNIRPGDVVHDLGQMGWPKMRIVRKEADSVTDYADARGQDMRDFEKNALMNAQPDNAVYLATFLTDSPLKAASTHYPVPASRIAKQDLHGEATPISDGDSAVFHPADEAVVQALEDFLFHLRKFQTVDEVDAAVNMNPVTDAIRAAAGDDLFHVADDLAVARLEDWKASQPSAGAGEPETGADEDPDSDGDQDPDSDGLEDFEDYDGDD